MNPIKEFYSFVKEKNLDWKKNIFNPIREFNVKTDSNR